MWNIQIKILGLVCMCLILGIGNAHAQTTLSNITFPIQELQGCASLDACRVFCDDFKNSNACFSFAEKKGLIKKADAQKALKFIQSVVTGDVPVSGCTDQHDCANQCALPENQSQCLRWAKDKGFITNIPKLSGPSAPQAQDTSQVEASPTENTDQAVSNESNTPEPEASVAVVPETTSVSKKNDSLTTETPAPSDQENQNQDQNPDQNLQNPTDTQDNTPSDQTLPETGQKNDSYKQKIEGVLTQENGPGGCTTVDECATFCSQSQHGVACLDFAKKHGLMSDQEIQKAEQLINRYGPGGCIGQSCQIYCSTVNHQEECLKFALDNHFISPTEADNIRNSQKLQRGLKTFGGPGGCTTEEQCQTYCSEATHVEECLSFGQKTGVFNQQEVQQRKQEFQNQVEQPQPTEDTSNSDSQTQGKDQSGDTSPDVQPTPSQSNQEQSTGIPPAPGTPSASPSVMPSASASPSPASSPQPSTFYSPSPLTSPSPSNSPYYSPNSPTPSNTNNPTPTCYTYNGTTTCVVPSQTPNQTATPSPSNSTASMSPCPSGQYYDTARQSCGTPSDNCVAHSGTWNGTICLMPSSMPNQTVAPSSSPSNSPYPSNTSAPSSPDNPATSCSKYGGTWNGTTCVMPSHSSLVSSILRFFESLFSLK